MEAPQLAYEFKQFLFFLTFPENKRRVYAEIFAGLSEQEVDRLEVLLFERRNYCPLPKYQRKIHLNP